MFHSHGISPGKMGTTITHNQLLFVFKVGNVLVVAIILKDKELRKHTSNLYLLSLVTARASIGEQICLLHWDSWRVLSCNCSELLLVKEIHSLPLLCWDSMTARAGAQLQVWFLKWFQEFWLFLLGLQGCSVKSKWYLKYSMVYACPSDKWLCCMGGPRSNLDLFVVCPLLPVSRFCWAKQMIFLIVK